MKAYGDAAILAVKMVNERQAGDPVAAWRVAVREKFSHSASLQAKGCPKGAFLGLCSAGFVRGIAPGEYTNSELNRSYAVISVARRGNLAGRMYVECSSIRRSTTRSMKRFIWKDTPLDLCRSI